MSLFPVELESERLRFRRIHPEETDVFEFYEHQKQGAPGIEDITRYVTWNPAATPKESVAFIESSGKRFENGEAASYVVRPREGEESAGEFAGVAGIGVDWDTRTATFGTWLRRPFWGRGYSGERAARFMELAFDRLDLECVAVTHDPENERSERATSKYVERFGGRREGLIRNDAVIDDEPRDSVRYSVLEAEWAANR